MAPMMLLAIGVPGTPDPIAKRIGGTAGVIAIPRDVGSGDARSTCSPARAGRARPRWPASWPRH